MGLEHVHRAGYVYRDLKPENVLVRANGSICIADFGLARLLPEGARAFTNCGTGDYCSPELLQFHGTTRAADVWALGVFLFEITAGYPPFKGATQAEQFRAIIAADLGVRPARYCPPPPCHLYALRRF